MLNIPQNGRSKNPIYTYVFFESEMIDSCKEEVITMERLYTQVRSVNRN